MATVALSLGSTRTPTDEPALLETFGPDHACYLSPSREGRALHRTVIDEILRTNGQSFRIKDSHDVT